MLHIELLWRTPGDSNESDVGFGVVSGETRSVGSDVDLHFLRAGVGSHAEALAEASERWFDEVDDCGWVYAAPAWAGSLDRDDTDGAGPENVNFRQSEIVPIW